MRQSAVLLFAVLASVVAAAAMYALGLAFCRAVIEAVSAAGTR